MGVVFYPKSPRRMPEEKLSGLLAAIPVGRRVAVEVAPAPGMLKKLEALGFDFFQVHYDPAETPEPALARWAAEVGSERLWLAPRLPPGAAFPEAALAAAQTLLVDTFQKGTYGGTGRTGDWSHFKSLYEKHPKHAWVLSGGLRPENIRAAVQATNARVVDVNSGVESAPGVKDAGKLDMLFANLAEL
jgi:phosphoribosylanthranilate isomerase